MVTMKTTLDPKRRIPSTSTRLSKLIHQKLRMAFPNRHQLPFRPGIRPPVSVLPMIPSVPFPPIPSAPVPSIAPITTGLCLCLPLHWQCSPDTCTTAGTGAREGVEVQEPDSLTGWAIEMTIPDLCKAVLRSCRTCTLIYTSLTTAGANVRWQPISQIKVSYDGHLVFKPDPGGQQHYEFDLLLDPASCTYISRQQDHY